MLQRNYPSSEVLIHLPQSFTARLVNQPQLKFQPSVYLLSILLTLLAIAFTPKGDWGSLGFYSLGIAGWLIRLRIYLKISMRSLFSRVTVEFLFIGLILLSTLFHTGGEVIFNWGWLQITSQGLITLITVSFKTFLSLLLVNSLLSILSQTQILNAFLALHFPPLFVAIMGSMLRYLHLLNREFQTKKRAALSRNLLLNPRQTRQVTANLIGSLLIRSYDRGERIHQAMLARGYSGLTMTSEPSPFSRSERFFLGCLVFSLLLGQGL